MAIRDPGGPVVMVCMGQGCTGLRTLAGGRGQAAELQDAVRSTQGGILIATDCVGGCSLGALTGVAHRNGETGATGRTVWLTGVHEQKRADALVHWVRTGGPAAHADPDADLPVALIEAVAALGAPPRLSRRGD